MGGRGNTSSWTLPKLIVRGFGHEISDVRLLLERQEEPLIGGGRVRLTVVHVEAHRHSVQHADHPADMVRMWMGSDQKVDLVDTHFAE